MAARHHTLSSSIASLHGDEQAVGSPLNDTELAALRRTRLFGATGTVVMAIGALGAGARPVVQDPTFGVRLLNLPSRIQTVSLTMTTTGAVMMALAWLMLGRFALGNAADVARRPGPNPAAVGAAAVDRPADVQQGRLLLSGAEPDLVGRSGPVSGGPGLGARPVPHLHAVRADAVARDARTLRPAVLVDRARHLGDHRGKHRRRRALSPAGRAAGRGTDRVGDAAAGPALRRRRGQRAVAGGGQSAADHASGGRRAQRGADAGPDAGRGRIRVARRRCAAITAHVVEDGPGDDAGLAGEEPGSPRTGNRWGCWSPAPC